MPACHLAACTCLLWAEVVLRLTSPESKHHAALLCTIQMLIDGVQHCYYMSRVTTGGRSASAAAASRGRGRQRHQSSSRASTRTPSPSPSKALTRTPSRSLTRIPSRWRTRSPTPPRAAATRPAAAQAASTPAAHARSQHAQHPRPLSTSDFEPAGRRQLGSAHRSSRKRGPAAALSPATPAQRPRQPDLPAAGNSSHRQRDMGPAAAPSRDHQPFIDLTGAQRRIHIDLAGS